MFAPLHKSEDQTLLLSCRRINAACSGPHVAVTANYAVQECVILFMSRTGIYVVFFPLCDSFRIPFGRCLLHHRHCDLGSFSPSRNCFFKSFTVLTANIFLHMLLLSDFLFLLAVLGPSCRCLEGETWRCELKRHSRSPLL
jgi:hypothetical protein